MTACDRQRDTREGSARPCRVAERLVAAWTPSNAGRVKGPLFACFVLSWFYLDSMVAVPDCRPFEIADDAEVAKEVK